MTTTFRFFDLHGPVPRPMAPPTRTVLCLGNFDGVHRAHAALLEAGRALADSLSPRPSHTDASPAKAPIPCGAFCFFRPSSDYLPHRTAAHPAHLTTLRQRLALFAASGMDFACLCEFPAVQSLPPDAFLDRLAAEAGCIGAVCGYNFRFGHRATGTPAEIVSYFGADRTVILPEMTLDGDTVSATRIRALLRSGNATRAAALLGRPYSLSATVTHGKQLGRTLGFPTANQYFLPESLIPAHGVYAARCHTPDGVYPGVANIGTHPTVDAHARVNCETYLLGYTGDLYGKRMTVEFLEFLRPEKRFSDVEALAAAIGQDAERVRELLL